MSFLLSVVVCVLGVVDWCAYYGFKPEGYQPILRYQFSVLMAVIGAVCIGLHLIHFAERAAGMEQESEDER